MPIVSLQRRMMQLGRVRIGEKGPKGEPKRLDTFRFTSASKALLDAVAEKHGGTVTAWEGAPDEGYFQVTTKADQLDIVLPPVFSDQDGQPTVPYSSWFEQWSAGGCQRRCDGVTEMLTGKPCLCAPVVAEKGEDARVCQPTTRVSFMLPDLPGLGVWRLDSHGWNSAVELPGTLEVLAMAAAEHKFIPCVLRIEKRTKKHAGQTRRYSVPVIDLPQVTMQQLASGDVPLVLNAPAGRVTERPALPAAPPSPEGDGAKFENDAPVPEMGEPPPLPGAKTGPGEDTPREEVAAAAELEAGGQVAGASQPEAAHDNEWAAEKDVTAVLELAARVGDAEYDKTVDAIAKHRAKWDGKVNRVWLGKLSAALLKKAPPADPEEGSVFGSMVPAEMRS